ncbi:hypothetical protein AAEU29_13595 [Pseudoalteromonas sp. SSM20]|uniref:hypothetical protein n=1 Tax=Pseudoalteromonas sp. SSM20 TaxID=3139394 RepID=UPI003BAAD108
MRTLLILFLSLLASCKSSSDIDLLEFTMSKEILNKAKNEFRMSDNELLFLLMVDKSGGVVKVKLVANKLQDKQAANMFKHQMYKATYPVAKPNEPSYREYFFPLNVKTTVNGN